MKFVKMKKTLANLREVYYNLPRKLPWLSW